MMTVFTDKAPRIMADLRRDFAPFSAEDAAAVLGNLGHESGGFVHLQELNPTVKGSRGGLGWAQWTGPRRRAFEAWCKKQGLPPTGDAANYGYLCVELRDFEKSAITSVRNALDLYSKVVAFEMHFERAGVKHYPSRFRYAQQALAAYLRTAPQPSAPDRSAPKPKPSLIIKVTPRQTATGVAIMAIPSAVAAFWDHVKAAADFLWPFN